MYRVEVAGRPAPKGSRIAGRTKTGALYTRPASKFEQPWVDEVRDATRNVMRHHAQIEPPYAMDIEIRVPPPKDPRRTSKWPAQHDLDKLVRSVIDGLVKGGALVDDRHVVELTARKLYGENAGATAVIWRAEGAAQRAA